MVQFKLVISEKEKAVQKEVKDDQASVFLNKKIGDKVNGDEIGFSGYEFEITGGSDNCGFPMRKDIDGMSRQKIFTVASTGVNIERKGIRKRKTVAANTVYEGTAQINLKVVKKGKDPLIEEAKPEAEGEAPKEEKKEEKPEQNNSEEK